MWWLYLVGWSHTHNPARNEVWASNCNCVKLDKWNLSKGLSLILQNKASNQTGWNERTDSSGIMWPCTLFDYSNINVTQILLPVIIRLDIITSVCTAGSVRWHLAKWLCFCPKGSGLVRCGWLLDWQTAHRTPHSWQGRLWMWQQTKTDCLD